MAAIPRTGSSGVPIHKRAVTGEWLVEFADKHGAWSLKTFEVVEKIVKPLTLERKCRFTELLLDEHNGQSGTATVGRVDAFVSHCWSSPFGDLVAATRHNSRPGRRYWVDIFAINQHSESGDMQSDLLQLRHVVRSAPEGTILVLCPRQAIADKRCNPIKRIWCVEELRVTLAAHRPLIVKCGSRATATTESSLPGRRPAVGEFLEEMERAFMDQLVKSIDVKHAEATVAADQHRILERVEQQMGFAAMNDTINCVLWGAYTGRGVAAWQFAVQGERALSDALESGRLAHAELNHVNPEGWTALHVAASQGFPGIVQNLLRVGAAVGVRDHKGRTPIHHAAWGGRLDCIQILHAAGGSLDTTDEFGCTPLHAARIGRPQIRTTNGHRAVQRWMEARGAVSSCQNGPKKCKYCDTRLAWSDTGTSSRDRRGDDRSLGWYVQGHGQRSSCYYPEDRRCALGPNRYQRPRASSFSDGRQRIEWPSDTRRASSQQAGPRDYRSARYRCGRSRSRSPCAPRSKRRRRSSSHGHSHDKGRAATGR